MAARWGGPYPPKAYDASGAPVDWADRTAVKRTVRWRVNARSRERSWTGAGTKGRADAFHARLTTAAAADWHADDRGWPIDPEEARREVAADVAETVGGESFKEYADRFYESHEPGWESKTRSLRHGHIETAADWLVYPEDDERLGTDGPKAGDSIRLAHLMVSDVERALQLRRTTNLRTRAGNANALERWRKACNVELERATRKGQAPDLPPAPEPEPERAGVRTVESFAITLGMVLTAAHRAQLLPFDVWAAVHVAEETDEQVVDVRLVPSVVECFELADNIAACVGGRGERYRALVVLGATTAPRPGELAKVAPTDFDLDAVDEDGEPMPTVTYGEIDGPVQAKYARSGQAREKRKPKARKVGSTRVVPLMPEVADLMREHFAAGYHSADRAFTAPEGGPLDWNKIRRAYWDKACESTFKNSAKPHLVDMTPKMLRKSAITWWLQRGVDVYLAAKWAGNSPEVLLESYAGAIDKRYKEDRLKLRRGLPPITRQW